MNSYQLSQEHNLQTVLWTVAGAVWRLAQMARQTPQAGLHAALWLISMLLTLAPDLVALAAAVAKVAAVASAGVFGVFGLALLMCNPMFLVGLFVTGLFAVVTYPKRKAVRK